MRGDRANETFRYIVIVLNVRRRFQSFRCLETDYYIRIKLLLPGPAIITLSITDYREMLFVREQQSILISSTLPRNRFCVTDVALSRVT